MDSHVNPLLEQGRIVSVAEHTLIIDNIYP